MRYLLVFVLVLAANRVADADDTVKVMRLVQRLRTGDDKARVRAAVELGKLTPPELSSRFRTHWPPEWRLAVMVLRRALRDKHADVRKSAVATFGRWGPTVALRHARSSIENMAKRDPSNEVRKAAKAVLERYRALSEPRSETPAPPPLPLLADYELKQIAGRLESKDADVRFKALTTILTHSKNDRSAEHIVRAAFDSDSAVRDLAMQRMWNGSRGAQVAASLLYTARRHRWGSHLAEMFNELTKHPDNPFAVPVIKRLMRHDRVRKSGFAVVRIAALKALDSFDRGPNVETLVAFVTEPLDLQMKLNEREAFDLMWISLWNKQHYPTLLETASRIAEKYKRHDAYFARLTDRLLKKEKRQFHSLCTATVGGAFTLRSNPTLFVLELLRRNCRSEPELVLLYGKALGATQRYRKHSRLLLLDLVGSQRNYYLSLRAIDEILRREKRKDVVQKLKRLRAAILVRHLASELERLANRQQKLNQQTRRLQVRQILGK